MFVILGGANMDSQKKRIEKIIRFLKNSKGQGVVGFSIVVAFCVAIGVFINRVGLIEALTETYDRTQETAFLPSAIQPDKALNVTQEIAPLSSTGGGNVAPSSSNNQPGQPVQNEQPGQPVQNEQPEQPVQNEQPEQPVQNEQPEQPSTPGMPAGGQTGGNDIVSLASTPAGAMTILQKYVDYAKNHNLQQWQAVDPAWEAYQADGSPLGITSKDRFGALFIWNWQPADSNWTSWNDVSSSWQWSEIRNYYETWKNNNS